MVNITLYWFHTNNLHINIILQQHKVYSSRDLFQSFITSKLIMTTNMTLHVIFPLFGHCYCNTIFESSITHNLLTSPASRQAHRSDKNPLKAL